MESSQRLITIVCSHYLPYPGGVERYVNLQARECVRLGFAVRIITHDSEQLGWSDVQPQITIYRLHCWSPLAHCRMPFPTNPGQLYHLTREFISRPGELTIVHTRYYLLSVLGCLWARCSGSKLALIDHSSDYIQLGNRWWNAACHVYEHLMTLAVLSFRPRVFGVAQACVKWLRRFGVRQAGVCYNGVDPDQRPTEVVPLRELIGSMADKKVVLAVGRLVKEKGVMELVAAFQSFARDREDYLLVVIGCGELESPLREAAKQDAKILFLGLQPLATVMSVMTQAFVLVNPSNYPEGLPTILLEAGLCGLAVISTPCGGAAEIVVDGETGLLIERGEPTRIDAALRRLDQAPGLRARVARNLQERIVRDFSCAALTERFLFRDMGLPR
ncbi:MAG: glycosyltransferase family 4 protein [Verrucomicrobiia bacterium]